jgi:hypothetical protein
MFEAGIFLQSGFVSGGSFGSVLSQWQAAGIFSYVLPFLLIFALVFVIMGNVHLFQKNKAVNAVVSLAVALMALQFNFVSIFFAEIFPRFGIAMAVLLVVIIVGALFFNPDTPMFRWMYAGIGLVVVSIVIFKSFVSYGWYSGGGNIFNWFNIYWPNVLVAVIIVGALIAVVTSGSGKSMDSPKIGPTPVFGGNP